MQSSRWPPYVCCGAAADIIFAGSPSLPLSRLGGSRRRVGWGWGERDFKAASLARSTCIHGDGESGDRRFVRDCDK